MIPHLPLLLGLALVPPLLASERQPGDDAVLYDGRFHAGWTPGATEEHGKKRASTRTPDGVLRVSLAAKQSVQFTRIPTAMRLHDRIAITVSGSESGGAALRLRAIRDDDTPLTPHAFTLPVGEGRIVIPLAEPGVADDVRIRRFRIENYGAAPAVFSIRDIRLLAKPVPATVAVSVDPRAEIATAPERPMGLNTRATDELSFGPEAESRLAAIRPAMLRWPGGTFGNDFDWTSAVQHSTGRNYRDRLTAVRFAGLADKLGAETIFVANYGTGTPEMAAAWVAWTNASPSDARPLGRDETGRDWKTAGHWAALRASAPLAKDDGLNHLRAAHPAPYGRKLWEIGNENYGEWSPDAHGVTTSGITLAGRPHDPITYAETFKRFAAAMKEVDPTVRLGAVVTDHEKNHPSAERTAVNPRTGAAEAGWTPLMLSRMKALGVAPDFVQYHRYAAPGGKECDPLLLADFDGVKRAGRDIRNDLRDYLGAPGATVEMLVTEHNAATRPGKQSVSLTNALYLADANADLITSEFTRRLWFQFHNAELTEGNDDPLLYGWRHYGSLGLLARGGLDNGPAAGAPYPTWHAAKLLADWAAGGGKIVKSDSESPFLSVHALRRPGGGLSLLIVNKSVTRDITAAVSVPGLTPATARRFTYGKPQDLAETGPEQTALTVNAGGFSATFPAYSITRIELP